MALERSCNRCGASVEKPVDPTPRIVVVPASSPSTNPVAADMDCQIGVVTGVGANDAPIDYCAPCLLSALLARAMPSADLQVANAAVVAIATARQAVAAIAEPDPLVIAEKAPR